MSIVIERVLMAGVLVGVHSKRVLMAGDIVSVNSKTFDGWCPRWCP